MGEKELVNEEVKGYNGHYRSSTFSGKRSKKVEMGEALSKASEHPGWALKEIFDNKLVHMIDFKDQKRHEDYRYVIDFETRKFFLDRKLEGGHYEMCNVHLEPIEETEFRGLRNRWFKNRQRHQDMIPYHKKEEERTNLNIKLEKLERKLEKLNSDLAVLDKGIGGYRNRLKECLSYNEKYFWLDTLQEFAALEYKMIENATALLEQGPDKF